MEGKFKKLINMFLLILEKNLYMMYDKEVDKAQTNKNAVRTEK